MAFKWKGPSARALSNALAQADREGRARARDAAHTEASFIMEIAEDQAPFDTGELEKAFKLNINRLRSDRTIFNVEVGGMVDGVNVDEYAWVMHEASYKLGPGSLAKQSGVGRLVGPKYLERAYDEREGPMMSAILQALLSGVQNHVG